MAEVSVPLNYPEGAASAKLTARTASYEPTEEEAKALKLVESRFEKAKKWRRKYDQNWLDDYKMFRGHQWKEQRPSYRHSEVINFVFQTIQGQVPVMTDSRPTFEFLPQEPQDMEIASIFNDVSKADWERKNWLFKLTEVIYNAHFYGTGIGEVCFNPKLDGPTGGIDFNCKDTFYFFPDPDATDVNDDERGDYVIFAEPVSVAKLKRDYPAKKEYIKPDIIDLTQGDKTDLDYVKFRSPVDTAATIEGTSAYDLANWDRCIKITLWCKSDEYDETEEKDEAGNISYVQKLRYPNGRKICIASGVVLDDGPNPYEDGKFPFFKLNNYIDPNSFWGISEVEQIRSPQKIFNKLVSYALDVLYLMGNPIWIVDNTAGVDTDNLFNKPGLIIEKNPNSTVERQEGVQLQPYVLQLIDKMQEWFQEISGRTDVTQGAAPNGVTAGNAIMALQDSAQTRMRLKSRNLDAALQDMGQLYKSRLMQFTPAPRVVRLTNNENATKYFKYSIEPVTDENGNQHKKLSVRDYVQNPQTGQYGEALQTRDYIIKADFDVKVSTGSTLPTAKAQRANLAQMLFNSKAIDQIEFLKAVEWPNYEGVIARMKQEALQVAQARAQTGQGGQAPAQS